MRLLRRRGLLYAPPVVAAGGGGTPGAWNSADKSNMTLSGSDLIADADAAGTHRWVRSTNGYSSGKRCFEVTMSASAVNNGVGISTTAYIGGNYLGLGAGTLNLAWYQDGNVYWNNGSIASGTGFVVTDVLMVCIDFGGALAYFKKNGGWAFSTDGDAETGGKALTGITGTYYVTVDADNQFSQFTLTANPTSPAAYSDW